MADKAEPKAEQYEASVTQAIDALRGNVKWTLISFGAIATTLLAGSQLSNIGRFHLNEPRFLFGAGCALIALVAAAYAVNSAMKVAYAGYTEFFDLGDEQRNFVQRNPALLEGFANVSALSLAYQRCIEERHQELIAAQPDPRNLRDNEIWFNYLSRLVGRIVAYVRYDVIKAQAEVSRRELRYASVIAGATLIGFAWAANPKAEQGAVILQSPTSAATLKLTDQGKAVLSPVIGAQCAAQDRIDVIVLNVATTGSDVITLKSKNCQLARFTISDALGRLTPTAP
jgi:hypothetical protein